VKERLTGAIILVALIVLWVPELLTGPIRSAPRAAALTPAGEPPLRSYTINLTDDAHARPAAAHPSGPEPPAPLAAAAPPEGAAEQSPPAALPPTPAQDLRAEPAPAPAQPPSAAPPTAAPGAASTAGAMRAAAAPATSGARAMGVAGAWMVQLGSFASRSNAEHLARQVRAQGFQASVSQGTSGRRLYRVRVGPAHDRTAATQLAQKLRASGHSGELVPR
jgi:DedD protein